MLQASYDELMRKDYLVLFFPLRSDLVDQAVAFIDIFLLQPHHHLLLLAFRRRPISTTIIIYALKFYFQRNSLSHRSNSRVMTLVF
ncbi:unnamed protein product, partial [Prunus brigantina]